MNYKEAFAVDNIYFNKGKNNTTQILEEFQLNNFDYYFPKLDSDFYLKYFIRELLIETDILKLNEFLEYHFDYCDNPDLYFLILDSKIIPKIEEIIEHAEPNPEIGGYYGQTKLEDGFVESDGIIHKPIYEYHLIYHYVGMERLQKDLQKRIEIISSFLVHHKNSNRLKPLKWIGKASQLAIIIDELISKGYIEADKKNGEINYASLSKNLFNVFSIQHCNSPKTLEIYLSSGNPKHEKAKKPFKDRGFSIPDANFT